MQGQDAPEIFPIYFQRQPNYTRLSYHDTLNEVTHTQFCPDLITNTNCDATNIDVRSEHKKRACAKARQANEGTQGDSAPLNTDRDTPPQDQDDNGPSTSTQAAEAQLQGTKKPNVFKRVGKKIVKHTTTAVMKVGTRVGLRSSKKTSLEADATLDVNPRLSSMIAVTTNPSSDTVESAQQTAESGACSGQPMELDAEKSGQFADKSINTPDDDDDDDMV